MVKLFKNKGPSKDQGKIAFGIDHLAGIVTSNRKNKKSKDTHSTASKDTTDNKSDFSVIFEDPKLNQYQLMTTAAKSASFGQCFFARHQKSGDVVMIMAIKNEFMNKFKADLSDPSKLKALMASVDPSLKGLREMIEMRSSTALVLDVNMNPSKPRDCDEVRTIEDITTYGDNTTYADTTTYATPMTDTDEPFDDFGSWLQYWVCGAPSDLVLCNAHLVGARPPAIAAFPEYSDENNDYLNLKTNRASNSKKTFGGEDLKEARSPETDVRSVGIQSRIVDIDDAQTVAVSKRITQQYKVRSRKNSNRHFKSIASELASVDGSKTLPSAYSMDSYSIPPEEDWFSMLDELLTIDLKR